MPFGKSISCKAEQVTSFFDTSWFNWSLIFFVLDSVVSIPIVKSTELLIHQNLWPYPLSAPFHWPSLQKEWGRKRGYSNDRFRDKDAAVLHGTKSFALCWPGCSHHVQKHVWTPEIDEILQCGYPEDLYAVSITKDDNIVMINNIYNNIYKLVYILFHVRSSHEELPG